MRSQIHSEHLDAARRRTNQRHQHPDGRTLPGTVWSQKAVDVALFDSERYPVYSIEAAIGLVEVANRDRRFRHAQI